MHTGGRPPFPLHDHVDGILLLIARGMTVRDVAAYFGIDSRTLTRRMPAEFDEPYRAAIEARKHLRYPHGSRDRYKRGCRCSDCAEANRLTQRWVDRKRAEAKRAETSASATA